MPDKRQKHSETTIYIVYVLWVIGYTQKAIAGVVGLSKAQVAGIVDASAYANRAAMSESDRTDHLADLWAIRFDAKGVSLDGGLLDKIVWDTMPLEKRQVK